MIQTKYLQSIRIVLAVFVSFGMIALAVTPHTGGARASSVTFFSDTISDAAPGALANHTVAFTVPKGVLPGQTIAVTFPAGFDLSRIGTAEVDFASSTGDYDVATTSAGTTLGVAVLGQTVTFTNGSLTVASNTPLIIKIGTNAVFGSPGYERISNASIGSYEVIVSGSIPDSGATRIVIITDVVMTAAVSTSLSFSVAGVSIGATVNGSPTTTSTTTSATSIPFGLLQPNQSKVAAQDLSVVTNAGNGFVVTVQEDQNLTSAGGAEIDTFKNGSSTPTPTAWVSPSAIPGLLSTYGHFGVTTEDDIAGSAFLTDKWVGDFTTSSPRQIFSHTGAADGTTVNIGTTRVGYQIQISALQEAGDDYTNSLTYVVTPTF